MSGLAALFQREGPPVDRKMIRAMLAAAPYRGPDGMRIRLWDAGALGHARMAVTPQEEQEQQPLVSPRTGCALSADVRLDNRTDLLATLPEKLPDTASDAELILCAYEAWGLDAMTRLLGDFAFILWDPRCHRLLCVRDTSGQRTLFYRANARVFAAASEIQQLLQDPEVPVRPSEAHIRRRLAPLNMFRNEKDSPTTYYEGIYAVPAGHVLMVDHQGLRVWRYWELKPPAELRYHDGDQYVEHFRALLFDVVRARLRTARPVGVLLSGGLDSSSIVATAQQLYRTGTVSSSGFTTYSALFDGLECDERGLIRDIQDMYGFEARYIPCGDAQGRLRLDPPGFLESPNMGVSSLRDSIFGVATQEGVRVLLSGDVADSCVGGSRLVFDSLLRQGHLRAFWRHLRAYRRVSDESLSTILLFACLGPLLPLPAQRWLQTRHVEQESQRQSWRWLPEWLCEPLREELRLGQIQLWLEAEGGRRFANPAREAEYNLLYPPEIVRHPAPWPVEIWRPFADRRLHEFLLAIPPEQKFEPHPYTDGFYAGSKYLVRRAMRGILPESVRTRTAKTVFQSQVRREIEQQWPLYTAAFGPSARPEIARLGYVNQPCFWSRLLQLRNGEYGPDLTYVLEMVGLETWLRSLRQPRPQATTIPVSASVGYPHLGTQRHAEIQSGSSHTAGQLVRC
jgi:asparagine synthase (glutamine-hydrolysing)